jgi:hypothetical protein
LPRVLTIIVAAVGVLLSPSLARSAAAQSGDRFVIGVSGGVQSAGPEIADHFEFETNVETATVNVTYPPRPAALVDAGVSVRLWKHLGAGIAISRASRTGSAEVDARIPHPLLFEQPRTVTGSQSGVSVAETDAHVQAFYAVEASRRVTVMFFGGPSFVHLERELVTEIKYDETYPFDEATFRSAVTRRARASKIGFNAGADVRWMFTRSVGLGGLVRFSRATVDLTADSRTVRVTAGGVQAGIGIRLAF